MRLITVLILTALFATPAASQPSPVQVEREFYVMGTTLRARVEADDRAAALAALEAGYAEVRRLDRVLSSWSDESEVARLNAAAPGEAVQVTPELASLLAEADGWTRCTGGAFDPAVGALVDAWDLRGEGRRPAPEQLRRALETTGLRHWRIDAPGGRVRPGPAGGWLDTGGFGKGAALRAAGRVLREHGVRAAYLDFGGQVLVIGPPPRGEAWEVAVAHPERRHEPHLRLRLAGTASVSTSAQSERFVEAGGERYGHVLDPRTGQPVPAWGSVTVVARDPLAADALSTALLVMGPERGMRWAAGRDEGVLFLAMRDGRVQASWNEAFEQYRPITREKTGSHIR